MCIQLVIVCIEWFFDEGSFEDLETPKFGSIQKLISIWLANCEDGVVGEDLGQRMYNPSESYVCIVVGLGFRVSENVMGYLTKTSESRPPRFVK